MNFKKLYSGEHLKQINPHWTFDKWSYRHTFINKMKWIINHIEMLPKETKILDAGCGQGLLVQYFKEKGYNITGVDTFYGNEHVKKENILKTNLPDNHFDLILCLDVIEHFPLLEQESLIKELTRLCKPKGKIVWSIPNMAHLTSRFFFMFLGKPMRTAKWQYHPGDRAIKEYYSMLSQHTKIINKQGLGATIPIFYQLTQLYPHKTGWLYQLLKPLQIFTNWCFNVIIVCEKE